MSIINRILLPVDFSNAAMTAIEYTAQLIGDRAHYEVTFIYVKDATRSDADLEKDMTAFKQKFESISPAHCQWITKSGDLIEEIIKAQQEEGYNLIVMGTKGSTEPESVAFSNTSKVVLEADAPVLVVPEGHTDFAMKNVALALGRNEIDDTIALSTLHKIARNHDARVHVLTIEPEGDEELIGDDKNEGILEYYLETLDYRYNFPRNSDIEEGLNKYIQEKNIDLLTILPRNHAKKSTPSEGRLTKLLTLHAKLPILTID